MLLTFATRVKRPPGGYARIMLHTRYSTRVDGMTCTSQLVMIERLVASLHRCSEPRQAGDILLAAVAERVGARRLAFLYEEAGTFRPLAWAGLSPNAMKRVSLPVREGILWQLVRAGQPFDVVDAHGLEVFPEPFLSGRLSWLESELWIPVLLNGEPKAILALDRRPGSEDERVFCAFLASRAAEAIESTLVRRETVRLERELLEKTRALTAFEDWGDVLTRLEDRYKQLEDIVEAALHALSADKVSIMLLDTATDELVVRAVHGVDAELADRIRLGQVACRRLKLGDGVAGRVARSGTSEIVNQVKSEDGFLDSDSSFAESILCVPLKVRGFVFGVINFTNKRGRTGFTRADLRRASRLAAQASAAIDNARLYGLAVNDVFTGVCNRYHFHHLLHDEVNRAQRYGDPVSLLVMNVNNLSQAGFEAGNMLLVRLAGYLKESARRTDTVGRLGESTFGILLPVCRAADAVCLADRLLGDIAAQELMWASAPCRMDLRVGIASFPDRADSAPRVLERALGAMAEAGSYPDNVKVHPAPPEKTAEMMPAAATA